MAVALVVLACVLSFFAVREWTRPPTNARDAGRQAVGALDSADIAGVQRTLWSDEARVLGMSDAQVKAVLREVLCPEFKRLGMNLSEIKQTGGGSDWYALVSLKDTSRRSEVCLWFVQQPDGRFLTTLTNLYLALGKFEREEAMRNGREAERLVRSRERDEKLALFGMPGLCDMRNRSVARWSSLHRSQH